MKKIVIHSGFHPEVKREYNGEHICKVINTRGNVDARDLHTGIALGGNSYYGLDNGAWIRDLGNDKYVTDWTDEERWGRVEEQELDEQGNVLSERDLGFMILRVDRSRGLL